MRVLVTGGAGFIGSHVVDALLAKGYAVTVLDDLSSGSVKNIQTHLQDPNFKFIQGDIRDPRSVKKAMADIEGIIHEAAAKGVSLSFKNPEITHSVNVQGTVNLLQAGSEKGLKRFVYASSAAVYGEQEKVPIKEHAIPNPLSPYGSSKLAGERECMMFFESKGIGAVCLRYFNVYGLRLTGGEYAGVMLKFWARLHNDLPPIIYGDGEQTRDFVHVKDVVEATLSALERERLGGEIINVGSGKATSINRLCQIFLEAMGKGLLKPIHEAPRRVI